MKIRKYLLSLSLLLLFVAGCRTAAPVREIPVADDGSFRVLVAKNAKEIALGDELLKSIQTRDFALFSRLAPPDMMKTMNEQGFNAAYDALEKQFGQIAGYRFLAELMTPNVKNMIWLVSFDRKGSEGQMIRQEIIFRLITGTVDGQVNIISFGFF